MHIRTMSYIGSPPLSLDPVLKDENLCEQKIGTYLCNGYFIQVFISYHRNLPVSMKKSIILYHASLNHL